MNKLDAISRRGRGMRALVRLIKTAITGCGACLLIVSSTQLQFGGVTYALEDTPLSGPNAFSAQIPEAVSLVMPTEAPLDEAAVLAMFPPEPIAEETPAAVVYER
ncbi:MAG: hypothetical protein IKZ09_05870, partial [Clostridia bacterium]|nr:hypothetical protein [Clostridia bacterium]